MIVLSSWLLKISKDRNSTTFLDKLFQYFSNSYVNASFFEMCPTETSLQHSEAKSGFKCCQLTSLHHNFTSLEAFT